MGKRLRHGSGYFQKGNKVFSKNHSLPRSVKQQKRWMENFLDSFFMSVFLLGFNPMDKKTPPKCCQQTGS